MKAQDVIKTEWQLNQAALDYLLAALSENRNTAGEKYLILSRNLLRYFEIRGFSNPENAADEVIDRLCRKLESGEKIRDINTYALGIARLFALELRRSPEYKTTNELPDISVPLDIEDDSEGDQALACLNECLENLPKKKKEMVVGYYRGERKSKIENRRKLAAKLGIPQNALRSRAVRLRNRLETCIKRCLRKERW